MNVVNRLEMVNLKKVRSLAKLGGTLVTIGGATMMTFVKGPVINLPWNHKSYGHVTSSPYHQDTVKGALMIICGCMGWAGFVILQVRLFSRTYCYSLLDLIRSKNFKPNQA